MESTIRDMHSKAGGDLTAKQDVAPKVTESDRQLPGISIDSKKEHEAVLL